METHNNAVIFASYIPDDESLELGKKYLFALRDNFADSDIYIGINPSENIARWIDTIKSILPKARWRITPPELVIDSDASAYQTALNIWRESGKDYQLMWFGHTKGAVSRCYELVDRYINDLFKRKKEIENIFLNPFWNVYGLEAVIRPYNMEEYISQYFQERIDNFELMYLYSFYVLRGNIVKLFCEKCSPMFFCKKINDRYFFERDFYQFAFHVGYLPYVEKIIQLHFGVWKNVPSTRKIFIDKIRGWMKCQRNIKYIESIWEVAKQYKIQQKETEFKILIDILMRNDIQNVLEIGCYNGGTTICFALLCRKLISCDIKKRFEIGPMINLCNYKFIEGDSHKRKTIKKIEESLKGEKIDLLFIDGDHSYEGSLKDYKIYSKYVRDGGWIAFHDIVDSPDHRRLECYVNKTWKRVKGWHRNNIEIIEEPDNWGGIGLVQIERTRESIKQKIYRVLNNIIKLKN